MKYSLTSQQLSFFRTHGCIEFSEILTLEDQNLLRAHVKTSLQSRKKEGLSDLPPEHLGYPESFLFGRDLWREKKDTVWKIFRKIAFVASELTDQKKLRIGFDQWMELPLPQQFSQTQMDQLTSIQGLVCIAAISLDGEGKNTPNSVQDSLKDPFPQAYGGVSFFNPGFECDLQKLTGRKVLLVGIAHEKSLFVYKKSDLHTHFLKRFGLGFGDPLVQSTHPLI